MKNILYHFSKIQDKRQKQGRRYELKSILALVLVGYMLGYTSLARIYRFGKTLNKTQKKLLGFRDNKTPSHPTITETMKGIDVDAFEIAIGEIIKTQMSPHFKQIAIDGKSIRSTYANLQGLLHLVSAYNPDGKGVVAQVKSAVAGGEIAGASKALSRVNLSGKVVTGDAMFAQESLCSQIKDSGGEYLFRVKQNKKRIFNDIAQEFYFYKSQKTSIQCFTAQAVKAHGRIDERWIDVIEVNDKCFGGLNTIKQIIRIKRRYYTVKTKKQRTDTHYLITSLSAAQTTAEELLNLSINHWSIENNLHRTRDIHFKEDSCNILSHQSQQNNATMRNLAICLLNKINKSIGLAIEMVTNNIKIAFSILFRRI